MPELDTAPLLARAQEVLLSAPLDEAGPSEAVATAALPDQIRTQLPTRAQGLEATTVEPQEHASRDPSAERSDPHANIDAMKITKEGVIKACKYFAELAAQNPELADSKAEKAVQNLRQEAEMRQQGVDEEVIESIRWSGARARRAEKAKARKKQEAEPEAEQLSISEDHAEQVSTTTRSSEQAEPAAASEQKVVVAAESVSRVAPKSEPDPIQKPAPVMKPAQVLPQAQAETASPARALPAAPELPDQTVSVKVRHEALRPELTYVPAPEAIVPRQIDVPAEQIAPEAVARPQPDEVSGPTEAEVAAHETPYVPTELAEAAASGASAAADIFESWRHDEPPEAEAAGAETAILPFDYEPLQGLEPAIESVTEESTTEDTSADGALPFYSELALPLPTDENAGDVDAHVLPVLPSLHAAEGTSTELHDVEVEDTIVQVPELSVAQADEHLTWSEDLAKAPEEIYEDFVEVLQAVVATPAEKPVDMIEGPIEDLSYTIEDPIDRLPDMIEAQFAEPTDKPEVKLEEFPDTVSDLAVTSDDKMRVSEGQAVVDEDQSYAIEEPHDQLSDMIKAQFAEPTDKPKAEPENFLDAVGDPVIYADGKISVSEGPAIVAASEEAVRPNLKDDREVQPTPIPAIAVNIAERLGKVTSEEKAAAAPVVKDIAEAVQTMHVLEAEEVAPEAVEAVQAELKELVVMLLEQLGIEYEAEEVEQFVAVLLRPDLQASQMQQTALQEADLEHEGTHEAKTHWPVAPASLLAVVEHDLRQILGSFALLSA